MLGAVVQARPGAASIARPSRVAIALALDTLAVSAASLSVSGTTASAISASPSVLARTHTIEAVSVSRAIVRASLLRAIIALVTFIALARHLGVNRNALAVSGARGWAGWQIAHDASEARFAEAGSVVAVSVANALGRASLEGAVKASPTR